MVADVIEIQQLLSRYCHAVDRGSIDDVMEVFHGDAVLEVPFQSDAAHKGKAAIRAWYERYAAGLGSDLRSLRHTITTPLIEVSGDRATAVCYLDATSIDRKDRAALAVGRYEDALVRDGGRWWIAERRIVVEGSIRLGTSAPLELRANPGPV